MVLEDKGKLAEIGCSRITIENAQELLLNKAIKITLPEDYNSYHGIGLDNVQIVT